MIEVALCIAIEHEPWLVLLAVLICGAGAFTVAQVHEHARATSGLQRLGWIFLAALAAGATIWCTHFVAMIAYRVPVPVRLDPVLTMVSLILAVAGTSVGLLVAAWRPSLPFWMAGGALVGVAISAMHFTGMTAYRVDGVVEWRWHYIAASVACAVGFGAAAFAVLNSEAMGRHRMALGAGLLVTAIATLHFIAMTALRITPLSLSPDPVTTEQMHAIGIATALVGSLVIAAGVAATMIDRQTRSDAVRRLQHMALSDALTDLPNRAAFQRELGRQIEHARAADSLLAVIHIDLDRFKEINDLHGHQAGDAVLETLAGRMRAELAGEDMVARLGGDEFVALRPCKDQTSAAELAARLERVLRAPVRLGDADTCVGASVGIAMFPGDADNAESLVGSAELAMCRAKREGSVVPCFYDPMLDDMARSRRELAGELRRALEQDGLAVHYQVQTKVTTEEVTGYEALLRWDHPTRGMIAPSEFIPVAEENGLILAIGEWVFRRACADAMGWDHDAKVAVNVSPLQLAHPDLPRLFHQVLLETGLPPRRLEIELTESALITDRERALHVLRQIKALGIGVALDDFGTGYSSLETLRIFPFDKIKLDRFFISGLEEDPQGLAIIRAVLALGKSLSIPVLAEGIETARQMDLLRREGCDEAQGFLLGRPQPTACAGPRRKAARRRASTLRRAAGGINAAA